MAFQFPADKLDFTGANGITYTWDATDEKWRVKAFRSQDDFLVEVGENPPDDPKEGDLWWDSSPDSLTLFVYEGTAWVPAAPPVSLDGINATIDAALIVQNDLLARVQAGETIQGDLQTTVENALIVQDEIEADIDVLENKVEALEGTIVDGRWTLDNRSIAREGHFIPFTGITASVVWAGTDTLQIHPTSLDGKSYTFADVSIGDVIRLGSVGSSASFKCLANAVLSGDVYNISVELINSSGDPVPTLTYDFEFLDAFDPSAYATKQYVDDQDALNVKKTGDTMTGDLSFEGNSLALRAVSGARLRVTAADSSGSQRTFVDIKNNDQSGEEGKDSGYYLKLYHLQEPTDVAHPTTKNYVDTKFLKIGSSGSLEEMTGSLHLPGGPEATGSNLYLTNNGFVRWGYDAINTTGEYGGYVYMRDDTTFEIGTYSNVDLKFNATNPEFVHSPSVPDPAQDEHAANRKYVDDQIAAIPDVNLTPYVEKDGDTMTGHLKVTQPGAATGSYLFSIESPHLESGKQVAFRVTGDGKVKAGHDTSHFFEAAAANDVITKGYLDNQLGSINLTGDYLPLTGGTLTGTLNGPRINVDNTGSNRVFEAKQSGTVKYWINATGQARTNYDVTNSDEDKTLTTKKYVDSKVGNGEFYQSGGALYFNTSP